MRSMHVAGCRPAAGNYVHDLISCGACILKALGRVPSGQTRTEETEVNWTVNWTV